MNPASSFVDFLSPRIAASSTVPSPPDTVPSPTIDVSFAAFSLLEYATEIIFFIWLSGALVWIVLIFANHHKHLNALRAHSRAIDDDLKDQIARLSQMLRLKRVPESLMATIHIGPLVTCPWAPLLIIAPDTPNRQITLLHELAHLKRKDLWAALAAAIFRAINWPNPLVHIASRYFRTDLEASCDEYVLSKLDALQIKPSDYAWTLLHSHTFEVDPA